jgi:hypothetical protein
MLFSANYLSTLGSNVSLYPIVVTVSPFVTLLLLSDIQYVATVYLSSLRPGQQCECYWQSCPPCYYYYYYSICVSTATIYRVTHKPTIRVQDNYIFSGHDCCLVSSNDVRSRFISIETIKSASTNYSITCHLPSIDNQQERSRY